jgi:hypothetical protein
MRNAECRMMEVFTGNGPPATGHRQPATGHLQENDKMGWMLFAVSLIGIVMWVLRPKKSPYVRRITRSYNGLGRWRDKHLY